MRLFDLLFLLFLAACNSGSGAGEAPGSGPAARNNVEVEESATVLDEFMKLVNDHRQRLGLKTLSLVDGITDLALDHSEDMASGEVPFGHDGFSSRCAAARGVMNGGNWCGENVARGQETAKAAFDSWMNSSGHRANIENPRATHTGVGFISSSEGDTFWTQIFLEVI